MRTSVGLAWVAAAAFSQSLGGASHKIVALDVTNVQTLVFLRALVALALLLPVVAASRGRSIRTDNLRLHVIRGLLLAVNVFCSAYAATHLTLAEANAYALSMPLFLLPLGALLLSERGHWMRWIGGIVGFAGVLIMLRPGFSGFQWAALIGLLGALASALLSVVLKQVSGQDSVIAINFWSLAASALIFGLLSGFHIPDLTPAAWGWVLAGACSALALRFCYVWAYRAGDASVVEMGSFTLLLWGAVIGLVLFGEAPTARFWLGTAVMLGGVVLVVLEPRS